MLLILREADEDIERKSTVRYTPFEQRIISRSSNLYEKHPWMQRIAKPLPEYKLSYLLVIPCVVIFGLLAIVDFVSGNLKDALLDSMLSILSAWGLVDMYFKSGGKPGVLERIKNIWKRGSSLDSSSSK